MIPIGSISPDMVVCQTRSPIGKKNAHTHAHTHTNTQADGLTLTPMKRSLSTIQDSRKTKALLQQKSADTSVVLIFLRACRYR